MYVLFWLNGFRRYLWYVCFNVNQLDYKYLILVYYRNELLCLLLIVLCIAANLIILQSNGNYVNYHVYCNRFLCVYFDWFNTVADRLRQTWLEIRLHFPYVTIVVVRTLWMFCWNKIGRCGMVVNETTIKRSPNEDIQQTKPTE